MISIGQLMSLSYNEKSSWTNKYILESFSKEDDVTHYAYRASVVGGGSTRVPLIEVHSDEVTPTSPCRVSCTCKYFQFKVALGLSRSGATVDIVQANDIPGKFARNSKPGLCPHLYYLAEAILLYESQKSKEEQESNTKVDKRLKGLT